MVTGVNRAFELVGEAGFVYGQSDAILAVNAIVGEISRTDIPVLLHGESGTGKDVYGRLIHQLSAIRELPLVKLSCTALQPGELLTRVKSSLGNWEGEPQENSGTLFLDGIDELDLDCQRVLPAGAAAGTGNGSGRTDGISTDFDDDPKHRSRDRAGKVSPRTLFPDQWRVHKTATIARAE
jgi:hypothetical protein